jgi:translation elongation factor EF-Tu-like GTPase
MAEQLVGTVTHYFASPNVAVIHVDQGALTVGDHVHFIGHTTDFDETVGSIELDHRKIDHADSGQEVGVRVDGRVRPHDLVYKVVPEGTAQ